MEACFSPVKAKALLASQYNSQSYLKTKDMNKHCTQINHQIFHSIDSCCKTIDWLVRQILCPSNVPVRESGDGNWTCQLLASTGSKVVVQASTTRSSIEPIEPPVARKGGTLFMHTNGHYVLPYRSPTNTSTTTKLYCFVRLTGWIIIFHQPWFLWKKEHVFY